ncbi:MAG: DUF1697 domain-containing protein [Phycisphaerae bacterium]|nr:DUF1697 domain-containing protein [Phycisphaerae bacterium]
MKTYIALIRGINVGGTRVIPMKELVSIMSALGLENVRTYIQSGNAAFQCSAANAKGLEKRMGATIQELKGFRPEIMILSDSALLSILKDNPFPEGMADPTKLQIGILASKPIKPDLEAIATLKSNTEQFKLTSAAFYLHAPDGIGNSKLAQRVERLLGVDVTVRNMRTIAKLLELASTIQRD